MCLFFNCVDVITLLIGLIFLHSCASLNQTCLMAMSQKDVLG